MRGGCAFLAALAAVGVALGVGLLVASRIEPAPSDLSPDDVEGRVEAGATDRWLELLEEHFGIDVVVVGRPREPMRGIGVGPVSADVLRDAAPVVFRELVRYPPACLRAAGVEHVVLCEDLAVGLHRERPPDAVNGVAVERAIFLDVGAELLPRAIHHEVFHLLDRARGTAEEDPAWTALNAPGFSYSQGPVYGSSHGMTAHDLPGFVSHNAMVNHREDKADTFARMLTNPHSVEHRAVLDPVLARKRDALRALVEAFCPDVGPAFWGEREPTGTR